MQVSGTAISLSGGRTVWVARTEDLWFVQFLNGGGVTLEFSMNYDVKDALVELLTSDLPRLVLPPEG